MINIYNAYSGEIYKLREEELKNLCEGEIPLKKEPNSSCKKCYGRGSLGLDKIRKIYQLCPKCVTSNVRSEYVKAIEFNYISIAK
jgi:DnaJ-class molecular chaperone